MTLDAYLNTISSQQANHSPWRSSYQQHHPKWPPTRKPSKWQWTVRESQDRRRATRASTPSTSGPDSTTPSWVGCPSSCPVSSSEASAGKFSPRRVQRGLTFPFPVRAPVVIAVGYDRTQSCRLSSRRSILRTWRFSKMSCWVGCGLKPRSWVVSSGCLCYGSFHVDEF